MAIVISIDGIIGSGKSTLLELLQSHHFVRSRPLVIVKEDVSDWVDQGILQQYYEDQANTAFTFQLYVLFSRLKVLEETMIKHPNAVIISERTMRSDYMFAYMLYNTDKISEFEFKTYQMAYENIKKTKIAGRILLKCDPKVALERCSVRKREGEESLMLSYFEVMHHYIQDFFEEDYVTDTIVFNEEDKIDVVLERSWKFLDEIVREIEQKKFRLFFVQASIVLAIVSVLSVCVF